MADLHPEMPFFNAPQIPAAHLPAWNRHCGNKGLGATVKKPIVL